jgi:hypothetical protein
MKMTLARQSTLLILLLAVWGGIIIYQFSHPFEQKHLPLKYKKGETTRTDQSVRRQESGIRLDLLNAAPRPLIITKNIFEPIHIALPPPPKVELPPPPPPVVQPPPPTAEEIAKQEATRILSEFKYLGFLDKGRDQAQGFFSHGDELYNVRKGETLTGTFFLKELNPNQAVLKDKATGVESKLVLTE